MVTVHEVSGTGLIFEGRYYHFTKGKPAPIGFFIGAHYRHRFMKEDYNYKGVALKSKGYADDMGLNLGYKMRIQSIVFDFLGGYGGGGGRWTSSTDNRNKIDPFFLGDFSDFTNFIRVEAAIGIVFPKVPRK